jgi:hypothetical protein
MSRLIISLRPTDGISGGVQRCPSMPLLGLLDEEENRVFGDIGSLSRLDCVRLNVQRLG